MNAVLYYLNKKWFLWLLIIGIITISLRNCYNSNEKNRYKSDNSALLDTVFLYKTELGLSAACVQSLTNRNNELTEEKSELAKDAKGTKFVSRKKENASTPSINSDYNIVVPIRDTIIIDSNNASTIRCVDYKDAYIIFSACDVGDSVHAKIHTFDTLEQSFDRVPYQWWFFKFGTKAVRQEVVVKNPYTNISYSEYIKIKRNKRVKK